MSQQAEVGNTGGWTIAYLGDEGDGLSAGVLDGLSDAARRHGVRLVRFTRGVEPAGQGSLFGEAMRAAAERDARLLLLLQSLRPDGFIFLGRTHAGPMTGVENFAAALHGVPAISIGGRYAGIPTILCRSEDHIRHMILHMIRHHGHRRIAYMPPERPDMRIDAWRGTLRENGLMYPELEISASEWIGTSGTVERVRRFLHILLDERDVMLDAIVSCGPRETEALVAELESRRLRVPADIAVTGFEDGDFERYADPGVTTVDYPWSDMGYIACTRLLDMLANKSVEMETVVPGRVLYRGSCGCVSDLIHTAAVGPVAGQGAFGDMTYEQRWQIVAVMTEAFPYPAFDFHAMLDAMARDVEACCTAGMTGTPLHLLRELNVQLSNAPDSVLQARIETLVARFRKAVMPWMLRDMRTLQTAGAIFRQAQANLLSLVAQSRGRSGIISKNRAQAMQEVSLSVMTCHTRQDIQIALLEGLPKLDIGGCCLVGAASPSLIGEGVWIDARHRRTEAMNLIAPDALFQRMFERHTGFLSLQVNLLDIGTAGFGYVVYDSGPLDGMVYRLLSGHLGTAIANAAKAEQIERNCLRLMDQAYRQGMDEASVLLLRDIGNAWDSVNQSVQLLADAAGRSPVADLLQAEELLEATVESGADDVAARSVKLMNLFRLLGRNTERYRQEMIGELERIETRMAQLEDALTLHGGREGRG